MGHNMKSLRRSCGGQSLTEATLMIPLYLLFVFTLLQGVELGLAVMGAQYGAHSIAGKLAKSMPASLPSAQQLAEQFKQEAGRWSIAMTGDSYVRVEREEGRPGDGDPIAPDALVTYSYEVAAFPLIAQLLTGTLNDRWSPPEASGFQGAPLGPVVYNPSTYRFLVRGQSSARMNLGAL